MLYTEKNEIFPPATSNSKLTNVFSHISSIIYRRITTLYSANLRKIRRPPAITGLVTTNDGTILLIDRANRQIQEFRQDGTFERFIGGNHLLKSPFCVGVAKNGDIVVSDACQIKIFDGRTETVKNTMGTRGIGKGKLLNPRGLTVDIDNNAVVADCESHKIHVLSLQDGENS